MSRYRQSSLDGPAPGACWALPPWAHAGLYCVASRGVGQGSGSVGGRQRLSPVGGCAKGTPRNWDTEPARSPRSSPPSSFATGGAALPRGARASSSTAADASGAIVAFGRVNFTRL